MITGGTGSFGHVATQELLKRDDVEQVVIYSRGEDKQRLMRREFPDDRVKFALGDVRDSERLHEICPGIDVILHAAALKQIDTIEEYPLEAIKTNVMGTWCVRQAAIDAKVKKALLVSTDKAVKPINTYGMSKALAEKVWLVPRYINETVFAAVRYGNVLGSTGSVIPVFREMIAKKLPLTITHPDMTRFIITLRQAVDLVFYALEHMEMGEIFVPEIPACNIVVLAKALAGEAYPLEITQIRPGEKIHECLIQEDEFRRAEKNGRYYIIHPYKKYRSLDVERELTSQNARNLSIEEMREMLKEAT